MKRQPSRIYTAASGIFLLLQGTSTLAFRLYPPLDEAFPQLLSVTKMIPPHSALHILTGILAILVLTRGSDNGALWFATGFGTFYTGLALYGAITMHPTMFGLQPFDHPFHLGLGIVGLLVAGYEYARKNKKETQ